MTKKTQQTQKKTGQASVPGNPDAAEVADGLRAMIIDGDLSSGARITERAVAERFDCTASTTREAFHLLEKQGAIIVSARKGARVIGAQQAPPRELLIVWDRLRWLLGENLRPSDVGALPDGGTGPGRTRSQRLAQVEQRVKMMSDMSGHPRLAELMIRVALHVCIVAPEQLDMIEESLRR
ncbi:MAG: GntR family transcriptional regulator [Pseudomonadota bacterium]|nr:GntR family transcriptional regulator [Pseudomonadota bacterium]